MLDLDAMERDAAEAKIWLAPSYYGRNLCRSLAGHVTALTAEVRRLRASPAYLFPPPTAAQRAEAAYVRGALEMDYATEEAERARWLELAGDAPAITETDSCPLG